MLPRLFLAALGCLLVGTGAHAQDLPPLKETPTLSRTHPEGLPPIAERSASYVAGDNRPDLDMMATGSVAKSSEYTLRRSVLQPADAAPCVIYADGRRLGSC
jgi:hypothetical protein